MLASWGRVVHRLRWWLVALSLLPLALWLGVTPGERLDESVVPPEMESVRAVRILDEELAPRPPAFGLIFSSATLSATDPRFVAEVRRALVPLRGDPRVARIRTPWDGPAPDPRSISADGRRAAVMVELVGRAPAFASMVVPSAPPELYPALRTKVRSDALEILPFGPMALNHDFTEMVRDDLRRAELVVLPLVLVFLVVVFGSVVAAALPLAVGLLGVAAGMAVTGILARVMPVSAYAANVVSMIGLGVAIDYSLFVVSRHREELVAHPPAQALARAARRARRPVASAGHGRHGPALARAGARGARARRARAALPPHSPRHPRRLHTAREGRVAPRPGAARPRVPAAGAEQHRGRPALSRPGGPHARARGRAVRAEPLARASAGRRPRGQRGGPRSADHAGAVPPDGRRTARDAAAAAARGLRAHGRATRDDARRADAARGGQPGGARAREDDPSRAPARRGRGARHRAHRLRRRLRGARVARGAGGGGLRPRRDVRRAVPAAGLRPAAAQGRRDELPVGHRVLRRARVDLPGRPLQGLARLHAGPDRAGDPAHHVLRAVRAVDGLRGAAAEPHPRGIRAHARQRSRRGGLARRHGPAHHRRRAHHGHRLLRLRRRARGDDQGDGHRHGHRDRHGRHGDPRTAGAGDDAAARRLELVGARSAQAAVGAPAI